LCHWTCSCYEWFYRSNLCRYSILLRDPSATSFVGQAIGAVVIALIALIGGAIIYKGLDLTIGLRVSEKAEKEGLDEGVLQVRAYSEMD
jgi:Amt family ammonium transporter